MYVCSCESRLSVLVARGCAYELVIDWCQSVCCSYGLQWNNAATLVGKEMPISRIVVAVPNATVVLLD
jgi:hypothetical protein